VPVSGVRPRSTNTRHECFRTDAVAPTDTFGAVAKDDELLLAGGVAASPLSNDAEQSVIGDGARRSSNSGRFAGYEVRPRSANQLVCC
jgi:hypothetical protein